MLNKSFSIGEVLKKGWVKFKEQPYTWVGALILMALILATHPFVNNWMLGNGFTIDTDHMNDFLDDADGRTTALISLVSFVYYVVQMGLGLGLIHMGIRAASDMKVNIFNLFSRFHYVFHYLIAQILYSLIILAGLILLVFPAAIWGARFALYPYFIVDQGVGPITALKMSSQATMGSKWDIFGLIIVTLFLVIAGAALILLGLLIILPIVNIAWASVYRLLTMNIVQPALVIEQPHISNEPQR